MSTQTIQPFMGLSLHLAVLAYHNLYSRIEINPFMKDNLDLNKFSYRDLPAYIDHKWHLSAKSVEGQQLNQNRKTAIQLHGADKSNKELIKALGDFDFDIWTLKDLASFSIDLQKVPSTKGEPLRYSLDYTRISPYFRGVEYLGYAGLPRTQQNYQWEMLPGQAISLFNKPVLYLKTSTTFNSICVIEKVKINMDCPIYDIYAFHASLQGQCNLAGKARCQLYVSFTQPLCPDIRDNTWHSLIQPSDSNFFTAEQVTDLNADGGGFLHRHLIKRVNLTSLFERFQKQILKEGSATKSQVRYFSLKVQFLSNRYQGNGLAHKQDWLLEGVSSVNVKPDRIEDPPLEGRISEKIIHNIYKTQ